MEIIVDTILCDERFYVILWMIVTGAGDILFHWTGAA